MKRLFLFITFVLYVAMDQNTAQAYQAMGVGGQSCGRWTADRHFPNSDAAFIEESWVLGFLSGIGFTGINNADPLSGTDAYGVFAWIDNFCTANPIDTINIASEEFYIAHPN